MPTKTKSVYEHPSDTDGIRVLTTQYWPRGIKKALVDEYIRKLAPTRALLHEFKAGEISWDNYKARYLEEINNPEAEKELDRLRNLASEATITIMCVCKEESQCHRSLLKTIIDSSLPRDRVK